MSRKKEPTAIKVEESGIERLDFWIEISSLMWMVTVEVSKKHKWIIEMTVSTYSGETTLDSGDLIALLEALKHVKKKGYKLPPINEVKK